MPEDSASFRINLKSGEVAISGSEEFVTSQIEENLDSIDSLLDKLASSPASGNEGSDENESENPYPYVLAEADGEVKVVAEIPGSSNRERTVKATYLCLLGKEVLFGVSECHFDEIREICKDHAFYDSSNFAANVKEADIVAMGSGQSQRAKFTPGGRKKAEELAIMLNEETG